MTERILTQVIEVNSLPNTAVIETRQGYVLEKLGEDWYRAGVPTPYPTVFPNWLPAKLFRDHDPKQASPGLRDGENNAD